MPPNAAPAPAATISRARLAPVRVRALPSSSALAISSPAMKTTESHRKCPGSGGPVCTTVPAAKTKASRRKSWSQNGTARSRATRRTVRNGWAITMICTPAVIQVGSGVVRTATWPKKSTAVGAKTQVMSRCSGSRRRR